MSRTVAATAVFFISYLDDLTEKWVFLFSPVEKWSIL